MAAAEVSLVIDGTLEPGHEGNETRRLVDALMIPEANIVGLTVDSHDPCTDLRLITACTALRTLSLAQQPQHNGHWHLLERLSKLTHLCMAECELTVVPHELTRLSHLEYLDVRGNGYHTYGMEHLHNIPSLRKLALSVNQCMCVPPQVTSLVAGRTWRNRHFQGLRTFTQLRSLSIEYIADNPLVSVLSCLTGLEELTVRGPYKDNWDVLLKMPSLTKLDASLKGRRAAAGGKVPETLLLHPNLRHLVLYMPGVKDYNALAALTHRMERVTVYLDSTRGVKLNLLLLRQRTSGFALELRYAFTDILIDPRAIVLQAANADSDEEEVVEVSDSSEEDDDLDIMN